MNRIRKSKAFTLIELIVVIIIIGVLAGIASVAYNQFVTQARTTANMASVQSVATAFNAAAAETGTIVDGTLVGRVFSVGTIKVDVPADTTAVAGVVSIAGKAGCTATKPTALDLASVKDTSGC